MNRRVFLHHVGGLTTAALGGALGAPSPVAAAPAETLYNGITLPDVWPPRDVELSREPPPPPPYLAAPPDVIPINVGRQLFIDDFLIDRTTLKRRFHLPEYHSKTPVLAPDKPWEGKGGRARAGCFSDGVWFDPKDRLFKMWYWGSAGTDDPARFDTCLATSRDGVRWEKPIFDVVPDTNVVLRDEEGYPRNSSITWLDHVEKDPRRRFKMFRIVTKNRQHRYQISFSADGIHWEKAGVTDTTGDRSTVFYNPFRKVWVFSLRAGTKAVSRCRSYAEGLSALPGPKWSTANRGQGKVLWVGADNLDPDRGDLNLRRGADRPADQVPSQLYNLDAVAYESVLLGLFSIWRGQPVDRPKINEVCAGFSRDGFHWSRPDRLAFCPVSEKKEAWNWGNVQSAGGCCLVVGDKLYFYVGGVSGRHGTWHPDASYVGLAVLRRDGFASMDADDGTGILTTRPVRFTGKHLFVNVAAPRGELTVEVLDREGKVIAPFSKENCEPVSEDRTLVALKWKGTAELASLASKPIRFRFHLRDGALYAFWVSPDVTGASRGYVAAGGPGFTGPTDTVGSETASRP